MRKLFVFISILFVVSFKGYTQQKITGGYTINITDAPWQVILKQGNSYICGGSIIAPDIILTAKHCINGVSPSAIQVIAGITCKSEASSSNTFNVSAIIPHPTLDVALLKLSTNILYNSSRQAINYLSSTNSTYYSIGNTVMVSGWGWLTPNGYDPSNCLNAVDLHIISNQDAASALGEPVHDYEVACTGVGSVRQGACHGDSGGPLVIWSNTLNEYVLIGTVSWGRANCVGNNSNSPSVFVRVSNIVNWINSNISISGPSLLCSGTSGTFTVSGAPSGYTWTCSSGLTPGSSSGTTKTFTVNTTSWQAGWIAVNVGSLELVRKDVWIGKPYDIPDPRSVSIPLNTPTVITPPALTPYRQKMGVTEYYWVWDLNTGGGTLGNSYGTTATVTIPQRNASYRLSAYGVNACGEYYTGAPFFSFSISPGNYAYSLSAYPNPTSSVLNVDIEELETESTAFSTTGSSASGFGAVGKVKSVYTISLYNASGTLALQTTASDTNHIQLDVGSLPNGIYTLYVHDGTENPPVTQHIVISH
ncbi:MAG: trypsin-like serine protease [Tannerella sp.]|jgi:trypsin|nr:trypsin-like serine protease [Tannerella sp.]